MPKPNKTSATPLERRGPPVRTGIEIDCTGKASRAEETTMAIASHNNALALNGEFSLSSPTRDIATTITLPGDIHGALLAADLIPDPYYGENEKVVMWVNETAWSVERRFTASERDIDGFLTLTLAEVDCIATIFLNGEVVARTDNSFVRHDIDVTGKV